MQSHQVHIQIQCQLFLLLIFLIYLNFSFPIRGTPFTSPRLQLGFGRLCIQPVASEGFGGDGTQDDDHRGDEQHRAPFLARVIASAQLVSLAVDYGRLRPGVVIHFAQRTVSVVWMKATPGLSKPRPRMRWKPDSRRAMTLP